MSSKYSPFLQDIRNLTKRDKPSKKTIKQLIRSSGERERLQKVKNLIDTATERIESKIKPKVFRLLYQSEETVFGLVNRIDLDVVGSGFIIIPDPDIPSEDENWKNIATQEAELATQWSNSKYIKLKSKVSIAFTDSLVYGRGFLEICYNAFKNDIVLIHSVDPEDMTYLMDPTKREVKLDKYGMPVGYVYKEYQGNKQLKLMKDEVAHFKFWGLGEPSIGLSPLEPLYNVLKAKMNIEEALAEAIYRRAFPWIVAYVGDRDHEPSIEEIDELHEAISEIEQKTEFTLPYYFKLDKIEAGGLQELVGHHEMYTNLIFHSYGMPKGIMKGGRKTEVDKGSLEWERTVLNFQEKLGEIIQEQILDRLYEVRGYKTRPRIKWNIVTPAHQITYDRSIATLYRHGAINPDLESENYLRKMHGLPLRSSEVPPEKEGLNVLAKKIAEYMTLMTKSETEGPEEE